MKNIKGILFDKDGTLLDFNATWLGAYQRAADYLHSRFGMCTADALLADGGFIAETNSWQPDSVLASGNNQQIIDQWAHTIGQPLTDADRREIDSILTVPEHAYAPAVDDLNALLSQLRAPGIRLGLATMDSENNAHRMLRAAGIAALFDFVCGADSGHGIKPDAGMVQAFCRACELRPTQVMMVGDSPKDLAMGKTAGVAINVGVLSGAHRKVDLAPLADLILPNIAGLTSLFERHD